MRLVAVAELAIRPVAPRVDAAAAAEGEGALVAYRQERFSGGSEKVPAAAEGKGAYCLR